MARIKFDIETYKAHPEKKVVSAKGFPVQILKCDAKHKYAPIIYTYVDDTGEYCAQTNGKDLFFADEEPKLTEFENAVMNCYTRDVSGKLLTQEELISRAKKLLELAKKQLIPEFAATHYKEVQKARKEGKAEALKDLPGWKKADLPKGHGAIDISSLESYDFIRRNGYLLEIGKIDKLPKEDSHD